jgi:hypothetical protein
MPDRRYRFLAVATHPVQYMTPIFRRMATHPSLDFQVAYCALRGAALGIALGLGLLFFISRTPCSPALPFSPRLLRPAAAPANCKPAPGITR